jgi:hypothetical protein
MPPRPKRNYPWQRRRWIAFVWTMLLLGVLAGLWTAYHWVTAHQVTQAVQAIHDAGLPTTKEELARWDPEPAARPAPNSTPPPDNAAPSEAAQEHTVATLMWSKGNRINQPEMIPKDMVEEKKLQSTLNKINQLPWGQRLPNDLRESLREIVAPRIEKLKPLHEAATRSPGRFPIDYSNINDVNMPHLAQVTVAVDGLFYEAWVAAEDGNTQEAVECLLAALKIADTIRDDPFVDAFQTRMRCLNEPVGLLRYILSICVLDDAQLAKLGAAYQQAEAPESLTRMLAGEQVRLLSAYEDPDYAEHIGPKDKLPVEEYLPGASYLFVEISGKLGANAVGNAFALRILGRAIESSRRPSHEMFAAAQTLESEIRKAQSKTWAHRPDQHFLMSLLREMGNLTYKLAQLRCANIATAVERYRLIAGEPPHSLDALIPAYLPAIPKDPFDGQAMRYQREKNSYLIYSVAGNLEDNHGEKLSRSTPSKGDYVYEVVH